MALVADDGGVLLYRRPGTRSFTPLWLLEELGTPYESRLVQHDDDPAYLRLNPSGFVPTLVHGDAVVHEVAAICLYLGDRFGYGGLAPAIDDPARGAYLAWMVHAIAQLEPARAVQRVTLEPRRGDWGPGWRPLPEVMRILAAALSTGPYLLGERFTGADVMVGATLAMGQVTGEIPADPVLGAYTQRLAERPAYQRAEALNWGS